MKTEEAAPYLENDDISWVSSCKCNATKMAFSVQNESPLGCSKRNMSDHEWWVSLEFRNRVSFGRVCTSVFKKLFLRNKVLWFNEGSCYQPPSLCLIK
jgi:hypothetical protein